MTIENTIRIFAGAVVLASLALGAPASPAFHSANWLWLTVFVGANLFQSGFTGFCPLERILLRLGMRRVAA
jgi:Inner membrane protein YgaP-like, transmembrane domain